MEVRRVMEYGTYWAITDWILCGKCGKEVGLCDISDRGYCTQCEEERLNGKYED